MSQTSTGGEATCANISSLEGIVGILFSFPSLMGGDTNLTTISGITTAAIMNT